jgi:hypothetical protein
MPDIRRAFVHEAELDLAPGCDPTAVGAAVTVELCGHWDHEPPCRWPHNNEISAAGNRARFRTLFAAAPADEDEVRARIERAIAGTDGSWRVVSSCAREPHASEDALAQRLRSS